MTNLGEVINKIINICILILYWLVLSASALLPKLYWWIWIIAISVAGVAFVEKMK